MRLLSLATATQTASPTTTPSATPSQQPSPTVTLRPWCAPLPRVARLPLGLASPPLPPVMVRWISRVAGNGTAGWFGDGETAHSSNGGLSLPLALPSLQAAPAQRQ